LVYIIIDTINYEKKLQFFSFLAISNDHLNFLQNNLPKPGTEEGTFLEPSRNIPRNPKAKNLSDYQK
jgi:hypothetical protein